MIGLLICLIAFGCLAVAVEASLFSQASEGFKEETMGRFRRLFSFLDHDGNGRVTRLEAAQGLLTKGEKRRSVAEIVAKYPLHRPCSPNADPITLVECLRQESLVLLSAGGEVGSDEEVTFEGSFSSFYGGCGDVSPLVGVYCEDLVEDTPFYAILEVCKELGEKGFCLSSCGSCNMTEFLKHHETCSDEESASSSSSSSSVNQKISTLLQHHGSTASVVPVLITSDWHVEPWYLSTGQSETSSRISRFNDTEISDMFQCRSMENEQVPCLLNGDNDPPLSFIDSHLQSFANNVSSFLSLGAMNMYRSDPPMPLPALIFFVGDTQAHYLTGNYSLPTVINKLVGTALASVLSYFDVENVFWTNGNDDGPHDSIFVSGSAANEEATAAYASTLVDAGVVNNALNITYESNLTQIDFFMQTGYYIKRVDPKNALGLFSANLYVISFNAILGTNSRQMDAFEQDLDYVKHQEGKVYILGHYPEIMAGKHGGNSIVPSKYQPYVAGMFSGHVHYACNTVSKTLFTQNAAVSQNAVTTGYYIGRISEEQEYTIEVNIASSLHVYADVPGHLADAFKWVPNQ